MNDKNTVNYQKKEVRMIAEYLQPKLIAIHKEAVNQGFNDIEVLKYMTGMCVSALFCKGADSPDDLLAWCHSMLEITHENCVKAVKERQNVK